MPWSNIIANKNFGTIITNNGCGYTYAYNSGEFKITSWTNETVVNDKNPFGNACAYQTGFIILLYSSIATPIRVSAQP